MLYFLIFIQFIKNNNFQIFKKCILVSTKLKMINIIIIKEIQYQIIMNQLILLIKNHYLIKKGRVYHCKNNYYLSSIGESK